MDVSMQRAVAGNVFVVSGVYFPKPPSCVLYRVHIAMTAVLIGLHEMSGFFAHNDTWADNYQMQREPSYRV